MILLVTNFASRNGYITKKINSTINTIIDHTCTWSFSVACEKLLHCTRGNANTWVGIETFLAAKFVKAVRENRATSLFIYDISNGKQMK